MYSSSAEGPSQNNRICSSFSGRWCRRSGSAIKWRVNQNIPLLWKSWPRQVKHTQLRSAHLWCVHWDDLSGHTDSFWSNTCDLLYYQALSDSRPFPYGKKNKTGTWEGAYQTTHFGYTQISPKWRTFNRRCSCFFLITVYHIKTWAINRLELSLPPCVVRGPGGAHHQTW